jgi:hypothetical protein
MSHTPPKTVSDLIEALGDCTAVGRAIQAPTTTVHSWKTKGVIPRWRWPALFNLARDKGIDASAILPTPADQDQAA